MLFLRVVMWGPFLWLCLWCGVEGERGSRSAVLDLLSTLRVKGQPPQDYGGCWIIIAEGKLGVAPILDPKFVQGSDDSLGTTG
jgi:hypothetical protein